MKNPIFSDLNEIHSLQQIQLICKRCFDILAASFGILLFSPLIIGLAILVKLTSKGPIFYKQERIGYLGKQFDLIKFRTMRSTTQNNYHQNYIYHLINDNLSEEEKDNYRSKLQNNVTFIGKLLRKTSLDELPQLINILKGDMSIVGPRPHPFYEVKNYKTWYCHRLEVKPGLTGFSKLLIRDSASNYGEAIRLDLWYLKNWSVILDLKIFFKTFYYVISGKGAN